MLTSGNYIKNSARIQHIQSYITVISIICYIFATYRKYIYPQLHFKIARPTFSASLLTSMELQHCKD